MLSNSLTHICAPSLADHELELWLQKEIAQGKFEGRGPVRVSFPGGDLYAGVGILQRLLPAKYYLLDGENPHVTVNSHQDVLFKASMAKSMMALRNAVTQLLLMESRTLTSEALLQALPLEQFCANRLEQCNERGNALGACGEAVLDMMVRNILPRLREVLHSHDIVLPLHEGEDVRADCIERVRGMLVDPNDHLELQERGMHIRSGRANASAEYESAIVQRREKETDFLFLDVTISSYRTKLNNKRKKVGKWKKNKVREDCHDSIDALNVVMEERSHLTISPRHVMLPTRHLCTALLEASGWTEKDKI